jgi:CubicO group peptidase (beta-lactamase class C family)
LLQRISPGLLPAGLLVLVLLGGSVAGCSGSKPTTNSGPNRWARAEAYSARTAGDALLVWKGDSLVVEAYQNGYHPDSAVARHPLFDGSVLLVALGTLAAIDDGGLRPGTRVAEVFPAWQDDPQKSQITVAHLLRGTSGLETSIRATPTPEAVRKAPLVHPPGASFRYGSAGWQLLHAVVAERMPPSYLKERVLNPLGIAGGYWAHTGETLNAAFGAHLTAREWGRIGRLLLRDGTWQDTTLIADLRARITETTAAAPGFGSGVWINAAVDTSHAFLDHLPLHFGHAPLVLTPDGPGGWIYADGPNDLFMAAGGSGQRLYVVPSRDLVVVRLGRADTAWNDAEFLARLLDGRRYSVADRR